MFRFTIRELVLLTLVVALSLGWYADNRSKWRVIDHLDGEGRFHSQTPPMPWDIWLADKFGFYGR